jgi:alpha-beta hydrolase superfamily lysophospholipase
MDQYPKGQKFSIIAHSMGSLVSYLATSSKKFPMDRLANVFCLAGALEESPQLFNSEISEIVKKVTTNYKEHLWTEVFHLNLHGAARD